MTAVTPNKERQANKDEVMRVSLGVVKGTRKNLETAKLGNDALLKHIYGSVAYTKEQTYAPAQRRNSI
ncbi:MAG: hypothetical protein ABI597_00580 [Gammaproteobacteria bacterium]